MNKKGLILVFLIALICFASAAILHFKKETRYIPKIKMAKEEIPQATESIIPKSVDDYFNAYKKFKNGEGNLEQLYILGNKAMMAISEGINDLPENELRIAKNKMPGFQLNPNDETFTIWLKPAFFINLAQEHGTSIDITFFTLLKKISTEGMWKNYIQQLTDVTGCTKFNGLLSPLYNELVAFQKEHPKNYSEKIKTEIQSIINEFTANTCACDTKEKVITEMENFIQSNPDPKVSKQVIARLKKIKEGNADITFSCGG